MYFFFFFFFKQKTAYEISACLVGSEMCIRDRLNIYSSLRRRDYESGVFGANGIAGLVFYASLVAGLGGQFIGLHLLSVPYVLLLIVLPLLLIFLREPLGRLMARDPDWKPEKWGEYILQNFFELFEIMLSYLSNTMSFLRVGAFVLVHAGMMMAVFAIAGMFHTCLLYTSPSPRDRQKSRMPSSA